MRSISENTAGDMFDLLDKHVLEDIAVAMRNVIRLDTAIVAMRSVMDCDPESRMLLDMSLATSIDVRNNTADYIASFMRSVETKVSK